MGMKFAMEADALIQHGQKTESEHGDLSALIRDLVASADPIMKDFNGPGRAAFNTFKSKADSIGAELNGALAGILRSVGEQNNAFVAAAEESQNLYDSGMAGANFDAAVTKNV
ncbi:MAG: hypothetical protein V9G08_01965 [Dermatophilaceae bacterium]